MWTGYNEKMRWKFGLLAFLALALNLMGCVAREVSLPTIVPLPTDTPEVVLPPSATPLPVNTQAPTIVPSPTLTPTPEPITYTVTEKDDMFGVALRFGVSLDALKAANPTVIPNMMGVGTVLVIPITPTPASETPSPNAPTPTLDPFSPLRLAMEPVCLPNALGGAYCFAQLENISQSPVENPSVRFTLPGPEGGFLEMDGILLLNLLPPGQTIPALLYYPARIPDGASVKAQITDWLPMMPNDARYLQTELTSEPAAIAPSGGFADVRGSIAIPDGKPDYVWLLGVAYDADGQVIGVRRWEPDSLPASGPIPFAFRIYAIQGKISEVNLFAEAHTDIP